MAIPPLSTPREAWSRRECGRALDNAEAVGTKAAKSDRIHVASHLTQQYHDHRTVAQFDEKTVEFGRRGAIARYGFRKSANHRVIRCGAEPNPKPSSTRHFRQRGEASRRSMTCNDVSAVTDWQQDRTTGLHDAASAAAAMTPEPQSADTCYDHRDD